MVSFCGIGSGNCGASKKYCNDNFICEKRKTTNYTGKNEEYNYESNLVITIMAWVCVLICIFIAVKIGMNLLRKCQDGDMLSCFVLFSR